MVPRETSGTVAFNDAIAGWQSHCTACGIRVADHVIRGQVLLLPTLGLAVHVSACGRCAQRWETVQPRLLARLEARYGGTAEG